MKPVQAWLKKHPGALALGVIALAWIVYRMVSGQAVTSSGHSSPEDAISYGWTVFPAGITGWLEVSPDGKTQYLHDTGWKGDPYKAG